MNKDKIKELRAHAGKLVAEGKTLAGAFTYIRPNGGSYPYQSHNVIPDFEDGNEWRISQPKKAKIIKWEHPYFKGCATNYGELAEIVSFGGFAYCIGNLAAKFPIRELRLALPANEDANWQYFRSTPENDAKLRELAKMVKVEVRYWDFDEDQGFKTMAFDTKENFAIYSNYRIKGLQDGWTDNPEEDV